MLNYYEIDPRVYKKDLEAYYDLEATKERNRNQEYHEGYYYCIPKNVLEKRLNDPCSDEPYPEWMYDEVKYYGGKCISCDGKEYIFDSFVVSFVDYYYRLKDSKGCLSLHSAVIGPNFID